MPGVRFGPISVPLALLLTLALIAACTSGSAQTPDPVADSVNPLSPPPAATVQPSPSPVVSPWWNDRVFMGDEHFLVLINLGEKPVIEYDLGPNPAKGESPPAQHVKAEIVSGPADHLGQEIAAISITTFERYKAIDSLPPYSTYVIRFAP